MAGTKVWTASAEATKCMSNLRSIGVALQSFASDHDSQYPQTGTMVDYGAVDSETGKPSWIEQLDDYVSDDRRVFKCPANHTHSPNNYFLSSGPPSSTTA